MTSPAPGCDGVVVHAQGRRTTRCACGGPRRAMGRVGWHWARLQVGEDEAPYGGGGCIGWGAVHPGGAWYAPCGRVSQLLWPR